MTDCAHRRSCVMMHVQYDPGTCPDCAREDAAAAAAENDMGGNFSRDTLSLTAAVYGVLALVVFIGLAAVLWSLS